MTDEIKWYVAQAAFMTEEIKNRVEELEFQTFVPTLVTKHDGEPRRRTTSRLLTFNYVFIRGERRKIEENIKHITRLHLLYHRPGVAPGKSYGNFERKPMVVSNREMEMFIRVVSLYKNGAPMEDIKDAKLKKGDEVRIIGGPFAGVEGVLVTTKGKKGGKVVVSLSNLVAVSTLDVEPENLQVIRFASDNKHLYRMMDTFLPWAEGVWRKRLDGEVITDDERDKMERFVNSYSNTEADTNNTAAKLQTLLFMAYVVLGLHEYASKAYSRLNTEVLPLLKSERFRTLVIRPLEDYQQMGTR